LRAWADLGRACGAVEHGKPRPRRSFTPEFKAEIVELCRRGDRSVGDTRVNAMA
jgi:transposase-like protein